MVTNPILKMIKGSVQAEVVNQNWEKETMLKFSQSNMFKKRI
jgi:hypothetical protein